MKLKASLFSMLLLLIMTQVAQAARPAGDRIPVYICGDEVNEKLLFGEAWDSAIVHYTSDKKALYLATGWPAIPRLAKLTHNSATKFVVEGQDIDTYRILTVSKNRKITKIGDYSYPVVKAHQVIKTRGYDMKAEFVCIYFPENDFFEID